MVGISDIEQALVDPKNGLIGLGMAIKEGLKHFLRPKPGKDKSPLEELVGEKITPENTSFYVCGWQGTVDGVLDSLVPKGFVTERNKRKDGTFDVKFESYG